jgi:hypothetical protein
MRKTEGGAWWGGDFGLCGEALSCWFTLPKNIVRVRLCLSEKPSVTAYRLKQESKGRFLVQLKSGRWRKVPHVVEEVGQFLLKHVSEYPYLSLEIEEELRGKGN